MSFKEKMLKIENLVNQKIKESDIESATKLSNGMLAICKSQFPKEFEDLLVKSKIKNELKQWEETTSKMLMEAGSLDIDPWKNLVVIEMDGEKLESPMIPVHNYVNAIPNLESFERLILISFLTSSEIHPSFQVFNCFFAS